MLVLVLMIATTMMTVIGQNTHTQMKKQMTMIQTKMEITKMRTVKTKTTKTRTMKTATMRKSMNLMTLETIKAMNGTTMQKTTRAMMVMMIMSCPHQQVLFLSIGRPAP